MFEELPSWIRIEAYGGHRNDRKEGCGFAQGPKRLTKQKKSHEQCQRTSEQLESMTQEKKGFEADRTRKFTPKVQQILCHTSSLDYLSLICVSPIRLSVAM